MRAFTILALLSVTGPVTVTGLRLDQLLSKAMVTGDKQIPWGEDEANSADSPDSPDSFDDSEEYEQLQQTIADAGVEGYDDQVMSDTSDVQDQDRADDNIDLEEQELDEDGNPVPKKIKDSDRWNPTDK